MMKAGKARGRRQRRQANAVLRHGRGAAPRHRLRSGRTGTVHAVKLRSRKRGRPSPLRGRPSPLRGRKLSAETRAKMSAAKRGRKRPEDRNAEPQP